MKDKMAETAVLPSFDENAASVLTAEPDSIKDAIHLSRDEWDNIEKCLRHPEWFENRIRAAQGRSKQIPHRDVPAEERL